MVVLGFLSFTSPATSHLFPGLLQAIGGEKVLAAGVPMRIGALIIFSELKKIFDNVWDRTPATCVTGKWFIHCAMPLGQLKQSYTITEMGQFLIT